MTEDLKSPPTEPLSHTFRVRVSCTYEKINLMMMILLCVVGCCLSMNKGPLH